MSQISAGSLPPLDVTRAPEGGAIGPPAAIANAVNDALAPLGVELTELPITPHRVLAALLARS